MSANLPPQGDLVSESSDGGMAQSGPPEGLGVVKCGVLDEVVLEKTRECDGEGVEGESSQLAAGEVSAGSAGRAGDVGVVDSSSVERVAAVNTASLCDFDDWSAHVVDSHGDRPPLGGEVQGTALSGSRGKESEDVVAEREELGTDEKPDLCPTEDVHMESSNLEEGFPSNEDGVDHSGYMEFPVDPLLGGEACIVESFESLHRHGEKLFAHRGKLRAGDTMEARQSPGVEEGESSACSVEADVENRDGTVHTSSQLEDGHGDACRDEFKTGDVSSDSLWPQDERTGASKDESTLEHAPEAQEFSHMQDANIGTCEDELEAENVAETEKSPNLQNENWDGYGDELKAETDMTVHESALEDVNVNNWYEDDLRAESNMEAHDSMELQYESRVFSRNASEAEYKMFIRDGNMDTWVENQNAVNLVVDLSPYHANEFNGVVEEEGYSDIENLELESGVFPDEKEDRARYLLAQEDPRFSTSDLVWGKVRSHPWWPAQIFDPSDASEMASKYKKRDSYLVAYFGDHTFAWNDVSLLRPFRTYFSKMEKQSTLAAFVNATDRALDEIFRRVEFGLACYCTPQDVYDKIKSHRMDNTGIRDGASVADTAYGAFNMTSLEPDKLVHYVKDLALFPSSGGDKLELTVAKAQILSFYRSKGFPKLPEFYVYRGLSENEVNLLHPGRRLVDDDMVDIEDFETPSSKRPKSREGSSYKRKKRISDDGIGSSRKQRRISDVMAKKKPAPFVNDGRNHISASSTSGSGRMKKRKVLSLIDIDKNEPSPVAKKSFNVGESIRRIATQLTGSPHSRKSGDEKSHKDGSQVNQSKGEVVASSLLDKPPEKHPSKSRTEVESSSPEEMLSQLCLAARDPMRGYSFVSAIIDFFSAYRDEICRSNDFSVKQKVKLNACRSAGKKTADAGKDSDETFKFEDVKDTYWEKRIIHGNIEESKRSELDSQIQLDDQKESEGKEIDDHSPTALILNFNEVKSLPSRVDLIKAFAKYGPLQESQTQVWTRTKRAKVVFYRRSHAEVAFSSAGKFQIFGPSLVSYRLRDLSSSAKYPQDHTTVGEKIVTSIGSSKPVSLPVKNGVTSRELGAEVQSPDDNRQVSSLTDRDENRTKCEPISLSMEESQSASSSIDATQTESGVTVPSTEASRFNSLTTEKEESNVECVAEPLSTGGSMPVSQLSEVIVAPMESGAESQSSEADTMTQLPGNGGSQLQCGVVPSSLSANDQEPQVPEDGGSIVNSGAEPLPTECGATVPSSEARESKSLLTGIEEKLIECEAEPSSTDGSIPVSQLAVSTVAPMESGFEPQNSKTDDMTKLPENGGSQLQCGVLLSSLGGANDQESQVPENSESIENAGAEQLAVAVSISMHKIDVESDKVTGKLVELLQKETQNDSKLDQPEECK